MTLKLALLASACAGVCAFGWTPAAHAQGCSDLLPMAKPPAGRPASTSKRPITPVDLVRLRQIGEPEAYYSTRSALSISPDGNRVAFVIQRAEPETNSYCIGLAVLDLRSGALRLLDKGGEPILAFNEFRGSFWDLGYPALGVPRWSPDGRRIAWLRRDHGTTQVWIADAGVGAGTGGARQLTHAPADVELLAWTADGKAIVYGARTGQVLEAEDLEREGRSGFHYDDRFVPAMSNRPMPSASQPLVAFVAEIGGEGEVGGGHNASAAEVALLPPDEIGKFPSPPALLENAGWRAEMKHMTAHPSSPVVLTATSPAGKQIACGGAACIGTMVDMWWKPGGGTLYFLRRGGWARGNSVLYSWRPGSGKPRALIDTPDLLSNCSMAEERLICLRERATVPQRIIAIDLGSGRTRDLYDPNPEFQEIALGKVQRLAWRNDMGDEVRGDLVLPPDYRPGRRLPLIVTTYTSNGFLRGAMGDEYPIQAFAANGIAVLSYQAPVKSAAKLAKLKDFDSAMKDEAQDWGDRRRKQSAVMNGVQRVIDMGIADPARLGISGLSDGGTTVAFALVNSARFAAAATSSCCIEPWSVGSVGGPAYEKLMRSWGWPDVVADDRKFWAPASLIQNAAHIDTPLLMQLSDHEYLLAIDAYTALRQHGKPVDMFVYPDSWHFKYQPAQKLAVYQRNLDWFAFWLQGRTDPDPAKAGQYAEWVRLRGSAKGEAAKDEAAKGKDMPK